MFHDTLKCQHGPFRGFKIATATITPEYAEELLSKTASSNFRNRAVNAANLEKIKHALRSDLWEINAATISIDYNGVVIDGQHRLRACIETKIPFSAIIVENVGRETFKTIDTNKPRSLSDVIGISGQENEGHFATIAGWIHRWGSNDLRGSRNVRTPFDNITGLKIVEDWSNRIQRSYKMVDKRNPGFFSVPLLVFMHMAFSTKSRDDADFFIESLITGENLKRTDVIYNLRERLLKAQAGSVLRTEDKVVLCFVAWNLYRSGTFKERLKLPKERNTFPQLI